VGEALALGIDFSETAKAEPLFQVEVVGKPTANPVVASSGAQPMRVLVNRELQNRAGANPSDRSTRHIEVALPKGVAYRPGDHLAVVPVNGPDLVARVEKHFGFDTDTHIRLATTGGRRNPFPVEGPTSVRRLLTEFVELQQVATRRQIEILAEHTRCPVTRPKLAALAAEPERYKAEVSSKRKSVLDLIEEFPACEAPFGVYLEMLPPLTPRYYSISSSPRAAADRCAVTVGVVEGPARSGHGVYRGVCSNHLLHQAEGATVHAGIRETKAGFRIPDDPGKPVIMIGPGTGLAPFRGFLQDRAARKAAGEKLGPAILFFGCRRPDHDFIYADELMAWEKEGLVRLHVAFSRGDGEKTYVQDLIRKQHAEVWPLIEQGATVYVCGDGSRMEPDVKRALTTMYREEKDVDWAAAEEWMEEMSRQNRYVLDVWAGN
jgi:cytochrome P450/NADPH-cytochrome P450 reductase